MAIYVKDHSIGWWDSGQTQVYTTWRSPWYGEDQTEALLRDIAIKEYHVIWIENVFMAGWTVAAEERVPAVHAGMPAFYRSSPHTIESGKGVISVIARVAPIPDDSDTSDSGVFYRYILFGDFGSTYWPDYSTVEFPVGWTPPNVTTAPTIEWNNKDKKSIKISLDDYDPEYDTDDVYIGFQIKQEYGNMVAPWTPLLQWVRSKNHVEICNDWLANPGMGKVSVQARAYNGNSYSCPSRLYSPWSNELLSLPRPPYKVTISANPSTENPYLLKVIIEEQSPNSDKPWYNHTDHFEIEYTTNEDYFDTGYGTTVVNTPDDSGIMIINPGDSSGGTYFFRVRTVNDTGASTWFYVKQAATTGEAPDAPTTWTYTSSFIGGAGKYIDFFWTHNSKDGSTQRAAKLLLNINGTEEWYDWPGVDYSSSSTYLEGDFVNYNGGIYECIYDIDTPEEWNENHWDYVDDGIESDNIYHYRFSLNDYGEYNDATIKWAVKTKGVVNSGGPDDDGYSKLSTIKELKVYTEPSVILSSNHSVVENFPIKLSCISYPNSQKPISYTLIVKSLSSYEIMGFDGEAESVSEGQIIYTKYGSFPDSHISDEHNFEISLSASDIRLENNIRYSFEISMGFDSGLTATNVNGSTGLVLTTSFGSSDIVLLAGVSYDMNNYSALITPTAYDISKPLVDDKFALADNTLLSVYRKEYNGEMTLIYSDIENSGSVVIPDPHPSLKHGNYRIIGLNSLNGLVFYNDIHVEGINDPCIIIQWDEKYKSLDKTTFVDTALVTPLYEGSFLRLPYNIKISEKNSIDINNVKYIGRKRPVSYFGTQLGETATWNCEFDKKDEDTIYQLRRLAAYMGDVYVREPTGMGYWATVSVSFNKDYNNLVIPVSISVTRVEGNGRP